MTNVANGQTTVFIVEDNKTNFMLLEDLLSNEGYQILNAWDGEEGLALLNEHKDHIDVVLLDLGLPKINGFEFLEKMNEDASYDNIPVIVQTADSSETALQKVTALGVYFFMTKPLDMFVCRTVVKNAIDDARKFEKALLKANRSELSIALMRHGEFYFRTEEEALTLAASLSKICPSPRRQMLGLNELMINAIEHGNLGIDQNEKKQFIIDNCLAQEVERRLSSKQYGQRWACIEFTKYEDGITFVITDQGDGFDWHSEIVLMSEKIMQPSRRGIALAHKVGFDHIEYQGKGNKVFARALGNCGGPLNFDDPETFTSPIPPSPLKSFNSEEILVTASKMQERYLPNDTYIAGVNQKFGLEFSYFYRPSEELGGDHWGTIPLDDNRVAIFIIDFSSDGAEAAAQTIWLDGAIWNIVEHVSEPSDFLSTLNNSMIKRSPNGSYATMLYGILDISKDEFIYSTAGAPLPIVVTPGHDKAVMGTGKGLPLGAVPNAPYTQNIISILQDETLLIYSDGIVENPNTAHEIIGRAGAAHYFQNIYRHHPAPITAQHLLKSFLYDTNQPPIDDSTLICCHRNL